MELEGTSALVTGGTGGLGSAAVRALSAAGATVVVADVDVERARALANEVGDRATAVLADVADSEALVAAFETACAMAPLRTVVVAHGGPGVAERIVGKDGRPAPLENFVGTIDSYLTGTYNALRLGAAAMAKGEPDAEDGARGVIITTASIAAYEGQIGQAPYAVAKGGVVSLTLAAARDLGTLGIRVCCIAPGTMRTPAMEALGEEMLAKFGAAIPFPRRLGRPEEFGRLVAHIAANSYLNGEVIRLDGAQRFGPR